ncbi:SMP-30/gluconolaconase/LRE-like region [Rhodobiaceae bacterium]|nr:SMP-30/gluconolaconase/LRE-like region [Rhodobiaceae bacterium]
MKEHELNLLCDGFVFPETPRWHRGSFYCCSIDEGLIYRIGADGSKVLLVDIDDWVSGFCFLDRDSEKMVISSITKRKLLNWDGDKITEFADLSDTGCSTVNDMIRTERGDCYVGGLTFAEGATDLFDQVPGPIIRVEQDGTVSVADDDMLFPNGFVVTPDGGTLIVASTGWHCLFAYDLGADGVLSNRRVFATIPDSAPDGICLDAEGGIWVTTHEHVYRVLEGGEITDHVDMGSYKASACMLGGDDLKTLLITAPVSHDRTVIDGKRSGRLYTIRVDVPGAGLPSLY